MDKNYKSAPVSITKCMIFKQKSLSGKDYSKLKEFSETIELEKMVDYNVGDSFLREDFITEDICKRYRFIKTGNLSPYRMIVDFSSTQYCKPNGNDDLIDGDILIAKDGGTTGLGETSLYFKDKGIDTDYYCGEILRIRVLPEYNKWFILAILKSKYFKEYMNIVTPGGSTLRHSKLLALKFKVPYPINKNSEIIDYIGVLMQNLIDKERKMKEKIKKIDELILQELYSDLGSKKLPAYSYPKISNLKAINRLDTGVYTKEYFNIQSIIKSYEDGYFYIPKENIAPGKTPDDYIYTDQKSSNTNLWITPKNIDSLELLYETYINTKSTSKVKDYDIILSGIRYLGYGYFVNKDKLVYCNQNTLVISNSNNMDEQIYLLAFLTSSIGQKLQLSWRVDGMVPIIYKDDVAKIPIPKLKNETKEKIKELYYMDKNIDKINKENYIESVFNRNSQIGIYQLNNEILNLKEQIDMKIYELVFEQTITKEYYI